MKDSTLFYKKLTPAEVGSTKTHEVYVRMPNSFEYETFFEDDIHQNGTVIESIFDVINLTEGHEFEPKHSLRFVYYVNNANKEKRIPSLSTLFGENNVEVGDYFFLEKKITNRRKTYRICFMKPEQIDSNPCSTYYSKFDGNDQLVQVISDERKCKYSYEELRHVLGAYFKIRELNGIPTNAKTVGHSFGMEFGNYFPDNQSIRDFLNGIDYIKGGYLEEAIKFGVELYHTTSLKLFGLSFLDSQTNSELAKKLSIPICDSYKDNQQIFYGAPGTGKSYFINKLTKQCAVIRTTFHPDSDYSTFVGAYKPVMEESEVRVVPVVLNNGAIFDQNSGTYKEKRISYKFVKQAFLKAYLSAWKKYSEAGNTIEPQFLIIEEINRGNCAQIFGDLFQLLDRNDQNNFSTYPIESDTDLQIEIQNSFLNESEYKLNTNLDIEGAVENYTSNYASTLSEDVQNGRVLLLPPNFYIWATMNTSDQSLFPIDSAFKRRWKWNYVKISNAYQKNDDGTFKRDAANKRIPLGWRIKSSEFECDWWKFIQAINERIALATISDDKKLGYFFCKPAQNSLFIDEDTFVGKVVFYLWNDVFKDNDTSIFKVGSSKQEPSFDDFYTESENGEIIPDSMAIKQFLVNVMGKEAVLQEINLVESSDTEKQANLD